MLGRSELKRPSSFFSGRALRRLHDTVSENAVAGDRLRFVLACGRVRKGVISVYALVVCCGFCVLVQSPLCRQER
jgi:hypothetical protein